MSTLWEVKMKSIKGMINIYDGKMALLEIHNALVCCKQCRQPKRIIVDIEMEKDECHTTIWIIKEE